MRVAISAISETNRLSDQHMIRVGQSLIIPLGEIPVPETAIADLAAPTQTPPNIYRVRTGDTLSEIAETFGMSVTDIRAWNDMSSNVLIAGNTLRLTPTEDTSEVAAPGTGGGASVVYNVRSGDTLSEIASSYRTSVAAIRTWNLERDLSVIRPGDEITIYCATENIC